MMTLKQQLKRQQEHTKKLACRISIRDRLVSRELQEVSQILPKNCSIHHENVDDLSTFTLSVKPTEGFWKGGCFKFSVVVTDEYNMVPPIVKCLTRLWHPNINETGEVCLSMLRQHSVDGMGWSPTRRLNDVVWGLMALFTDLLNFEDPLNIEAAEMFRINRLAFKKQVTEYIHKYAKN